MKKTFLAVVVLLVIAIAGALYYVINNLDAIVKAAIEKYGSQAVQTQVKVSNVKIELTQGQGSIKGLTIANPKGFSQALVFSLGDISTKINIDKTGKDLIAIDLISIGAPEIFYEVNADRQGNLNVINDNLSKGSKSSSSSAPAKKSDGQSVMRLAIARFELKDTVLQANIVPLNNKHYQLKLPPLKLTNLKGTPEQVSKQAIRQIIKHAEKEIRRQGLDRELAKYKSRAKEKLNEEKSKLQDKLKDRLKGLIK